MEWTEGDSYEEEEEEDEQEGYYSLIDLTLTSFDEVDA